LNKNNISSASETKSLKFNSNKKKPFSNENDNPIIPIIKKKIKIILYMIRNNIANKKISSLQTLINSISENRSLAIFNHNSTSSFVEFTKVLFQIYKEMIIEKIKLFDYFGILVDDSINVSHVNTISVFVSYIDSDLTLRISFLSVREIGYEGATSENLKKILLEILNDYGLEKKNLVAFSSDGAGNLRGKQNGLLKLLRHEISYIFDCWCFLHKLNLVIKKNLKPSIRKAIQTCVDISNFVYGSSNRISYLSYIQLGINNNNIKFTNNFYNNNNTDDDEEKEEKEEQNKKDEEDEEDVQDEENEENEENEEEEEDDDDGDDDDDNDNDNNNNNNSNNNNNNNNNSINNINNNNGDDNNNINNINNNNNTIINDNDYYNINSNNKNLHKPVQTRWSSNFFCVKSILENFSSVYFFLKYEKLNCGFTGKDLLEEFCNYEFIRNISISYSILEQINIAVIKLQQKNISIGESKTILQNLEKELIQLGIKNTPYNLYIFLKQQYNNLINNENGNIFDVQNNDEKTYIFKILKLNVDSIISGIHKSFKNEVVDDVLNIFDPEVLKEKTSESNWNYRKKIYHKLIKRIKHRFSDVRYNEWEEDFNKFKKCISGELKRITSFRKICEFIILKHKFAHHNTIVRLAQISLLISPTTSIVEHGFSIMNDIHNVNRNRLGFDMLNYILFLKINFNIELEEEFITQASTNWLNKRRREIGNTYKALFNQGELLHIPQFRNSSWKKCKEVYEKESENDSRREDFYRCALGIVCEEEKSNQSNLHDDYSELSEQEFNMKTKRKRKKKEKVNKMMNRIILNWPL
jgi:hypothetical protein